jgi:ABC-type thiamine transport system substrate-binding protein
VATVQFVLTGGSHNQTVIGTAVPTIYGYVFVWNTTAVPGGTYTLQSLVTDEDGDTAYSLGITITVDNTPPATAVIIPSNRAHLKGIALLDASASASYGVGITKVQFVLTGRSFNKSVIGTATPTVYGWVFVWNSTLVHNGKYVLQSLATDAAGNTAYSPGITINVTH